MRQSTTCAGEGRRRAGVDIAGGWTYLPTVVAAIGPGNGRGTGHMTHYDRHYVGEEDAEVAAIRDIHEYLSEKQWNFLIAQATGKKAKAQELDFMLCFCGVQGFPNHAFIQVFRPQEYQAWFDSLPD